MKTKRYTAQNIFKDFRRRHPDMWRRGTNCQLIDHMKILVMAPGLGKFTYEWFGDKITWIERWVDEKAVKLEEQEMRPKQYTYFVHLVEMYMEANNATQGHVAEAAGVSRQSINKYMTGKSIPKLNTMRKICESLDLEFNH